MITVLLPYERLALAMLLVLLLSAFLYDLAYRALFILGPVVIGFLWVLTGLFAVFGLVFAFRDHEETRLRLRAAFAVPSAMLLACLLAGPVGDAGRWSLGYLHLRFHEGEYEAGRDPAAGPRAWRYLEGVPDGGVAIVRATADPSRLPRAEMSRLVSEPIRECRRLRRDYFLCYFD